MNANARPPTAKIYQFPVKSSPTPRGSNPDARAVVDRGAAMLPTVEFGSGWYHDAAVQADRARKF
jgi:Protein of unknown function (DUF2735)